jgi:hypothetical protein
MPNARRRLCTVENQGFKEEGRRKEENKYRKNGRKEERKKNKYCTCRRDD